MIALPLARHSTRIQILVRPVPNAKSAPFFSSHYHSTCPTTFMTRKYVHRPRRSPTPPPSDGPDSAATSSGATTSGPAWSTHVYTQLGAPDINVSGGNVSGTFPGLTGLSFQGPFLGVIANDQHPTGTGVGMQQAPDGSWYSFGSRAPMNTASATDWSVPGTEATAPPQQKGPGEQAFVVPSRKVDKESAASSGTREPDETHPESLAVSFNQSMVLGKKGKVFHYTGPVAASFGAFFKVEGEVHFLGPVAASFNGAHIDLSEASPNSRFHGTVSTSFTGYVKANDGTTPFLNTFSGEVKWVYE